jgi:hypothetical protein
LDKREEGYAVGKIRHACVSGGSCEEGGEWTDYVHSEGEAIFTYYQKKAAGEEVGGAGGAGETVGAGAAGGAGEDDEVVGLGKKGGALCAGNPIPQSYLDVVLGGLLAEHGAEEGTVRGRDWLLTTEGWGSSPFVDDREAPRCMYPLKDAIRGTRGKLQPELTAALQVQIDGLLRSTSVPVVHSDGGNGTVTGTSTAKVTLLELRKSETQVTGQSKWLCDRGQETATHSCPPRGQGPS